MSNQQCLTCHETKQYVWIGQGNKGMKSFYSEDWEVMEDLRSFLIHTAGKPLFLVEADAGSADEIITDTYEHFKSTRGEE